MPTVSRFATWPSWAAVISADGHPGPDRLGVPRRVSAAALAEHRPQRDRSRPSATWSWSRWAGMRGAVSLAAALALPAGFPQRELLQFIAFCVILVDARGSGPDARRRSSGCWASCPATRCSAPRTIARQTAIDAALVELGARPIRVAEPPAAHRPARGDSSSIAQSTSASTAICPRRRRSAWSTGRSWARC